MSGGVSKAYAQDALADGKSDVSNDDYVLTDVTSLTRRPRQVLTLVMHQTLKIQFKTRGLNRNYVRDEIN
jgi:hypothetical protein